jgi:hypothetical protein
MWCVGDESAVSLVGTGKNQTNIIVHGKNSAIKGERCAQSKGGTARLRGGTQRIEWDACISFVSARTNKRHQIKNAPLKILCIFLDLESILLD